MWDFALIESIESTWPKLNIKACLARMAQLKSWNLRIFSTFYYSQILSKKFLKKPNIQFETFWTQL